MVSYRAEVWLGAEETIRVVIADDQRLFANGLARIIGVQPDMEVIGEAHTDDAHVFQGIKAGAQGYILKDCTPEDLTRAIRTVHAGDTIMAQDIAKKMLTTFEGIRSDAEIAPRLTERELEVVKALAHGKSNKEIARTLGISEKTVRNHASNIYKKLHIFDRTQAVIYAIRRGLVDIEELEPR